ncbi:uncharacterized lipoprotein YddW (UPF0748 family) [Spirosoma lacussanchae]|uniref:glycoside hydrolase family 10 protein n=1 Tax=Spirosoma lacussanchae TaxID=1884249 RepID=UPI0011086B0D|nr:family 10 glycosylhydrolase [Spirosoma lacussanchae]
MQKFVLFSLLFVLPALLGQCRQTAAVEAGPGRPPVSTHLRGVWLTNVGSQVLSTPAGIRQAVATCRQNGINHIFVVMWNKGRTLYPSRVMKNTFGIEIDETLSGRDPLRELLDAAHADSIRVSAWMEYGFAAENNGFGEHILRLKPQWAALGQDGRVVVKNGFKWMNALNPDVQDFMLSLLKEVTTNYPDLDGIQGDDRLPALPTECGYNPEVLAAYKQETNGSIPTDPKTDTKWVNWRADRLNQFAKRLYTELKAIRPSLQIAMAPSIYPFAKTEYLQDWPTWVQNGWVDLISPQVYRYNIDAYRNELDKITTQQISADKLPMLAPGVLLKVGSYKPTRQFLEAMIRENRLHKLNNEIFFYYEGLTEQPDFFKTYSTN